MVLTIQLCSYDKTELFKIELFICTKIVLALNNLQRLICHKPISSSNAGALGNAEYPFIANAPRTTLALSGST